MAKLIYLVIALNGIMMFFTEGRLKRLNLDIEQHYFYDPVVLGKYFRDFHEKSRKFVLRLRMRENVLWILE